MGRRSYDQFCPAARALDLVGERWTLLIARELVLGQKRYTDLLDALPGIGPNVLAARLKHLQETGIVRKTELPPPAASQVYELTELGQGLEGVVFAIARWGLNFLDEPRPGDSFRPDWLTGALRSAAVPAASRGVRECYEFRVAGYVATVEAEDGTVEINAGPAEDPAAVITTDFETFAALGAGRLDPREATEAGRAKLEGDLEAGLRAAAILGVNVSEAAGQAA